MGDPLLRNVFIFLEAHIAKHATSVNYDGTTHYLCVYVHTYVCVYIQTCVDFVYIYIRVYMYAHIMYIERDKVYTH